MSRKRLLHWMKDHPKAMPISFVSDLEYEDNSGCFVVVSTSRIPFALPPPDDLPTPGGKLVTSQSSQSEAHFVHFDSCTPTSELIRLLPNETVVGIKKVSLNSRQTTSGRKSYLAVGTAFVRGEDRAVRGRCVILEVTTVNPDPTCPETNHRLKLVYEEEMKGPVSAIDEVSGYLILAIGPKLIVHSFGDGESLDGVAFLDVGIYVTCLSVIKNFILIGDSYKSLLFCVFQEDPPKLVNLGKDFCDLRVASCQMVPFKHSLMLVVGDEMGNVHSFSYSPNSPLSMSGVRLLHRSDVFVSDSQVQSMLRIDLSSNNPTQFSILYCTRDGELGKIVPISEKKYKRLFLLYVRLICHQGSGVCLDGRGAETENQHDVSVVLFEGINPRTHRLVKCVDRRYDQSSKNVVDVGYVLRKYLRLGRADQERVARSAGWNSASLVLQDLSEIQSRNVI